jgi:hypothetical protein
MGAVRKLLSLLACLIAVQALAAPPWTDPAPYCRAVGTIDAPDARYAGPAVPDWIARALMRATHAPASAPVSVFRHAAWRCLDGAVLACSVGANVPCDQKADASHTPPEGATRYCAANRDASVVPAYAAGRATIFDWRCADGTPEIGRQVQDVDAAGYPAAFWHRVTP